MPQAPALPPEATIARLPFEVSSVTTARGFVADALEARGASRAVIDDAHIVVGELVMNAYRHGRPHQDGSIEVAWAVVEDGVTFSVYDAGQVDHLEASMPSATAIGGRGLAMVDRLCRRWGYDSVAGTRVTADIPAPGLICR